MKTMELENERVATVANILADLVWDCCARMRQGEVVDLRHYLNQCPDHKSREDFQLQICAAALVDASIALQIHRLWEEAAPKMTPSLK